MKVVLLAGGFGTRLQEETSVKPKPMIEVGGKPILWHIMSMYSAHGYREFAVALGYKGEVIKNYFLNYYNLQSDFRVNLATGEVFSQAPKPENWQVHLIDTGLGTLTGGRLKRLKHWLGNERFMMTYGDGVSDINISELVQFHKRHGKLATVTAVRPPARFGELKFEGDFIASFTEKPQVGEGWINGGFFVLEPAVLDYIEGDHTIFERDPLERLASDKQLVAFRHPGFWQCMDTLRDVHSIEQLWETGQAPWKTW